MRNAEIWLSKGCKIFKANGEPDMRDRDNKRAFPERISIFF